MATKPHFRFVAIALVFSGLITQSSTAGIITFLPDFVTNQALILFGFISILCGALIYDQLYNRIALLLITPILIWGLIAINVIYVNRYIFPFSNYFGLWILLYVRIYMRVYGKNLFFKPHVWIGITILISAASIAFGNPEIGVMNSLLKKLDINRYFYSLIIMIPGFILTMFWNIRITWKILILCVAMIVQDFYVVLYLLFLSSSKALIPLVLLKLFIIGKLVQENYDAW